MDDLSFNPSKSVTFEDGDVLGYIEIDVVGDDSPELDEMFRCILKSTDGQGVIDESRNTVTFTIKWVFLNK